ncbi:MAG: PrgI family protein [Oscillospiraceae bacterium]|nr:PrgI family protein [Oscillospiraceae bacterium]
MEVKINREIREYTESMFFGLNMRQFICSILAIAAGVGLYFGLKPRIGTEAVSWVCILGALPFAVIGFLKYNGLTAEQFLLAWIRSEILMPKHVVFRPVNIWYELMKPTIEKKKSENLIEHEQNLK